MIKKNKNKHDNIALLAKYKLNIIEILISKALNDSNVTYDEFVSVINVLRECHDMKQEIKNSNKRFGILELRSRVAKPSYAKWPSYFEFLNQKFLYKFFFRVTNSTS